MPAEQPKKRGPKGGIKHQPGRGHDRKSKKQKLKRFVRKKDVKRRMLNEKAREEWKKYDALPDEIKDLLGPSGKPSLPRPSDD